VGSGTQASHQQTEADVGAGLCRRRPWLAVGCPGEQGEGTQKHPLPRSTSWCTVRDDGEISVRKGDPPREDLHLGTGFAA
jgi:hypothetical protein